MKQQIYSILPFYLQNFLVTLYNVLAYRYRYGGKYWEFRKILQNNNNLSKNELETIQFNKLKELLIHAKANSPYYESKLANLNIKKLNSLNDLSKIDFLSKDIIRENLNSISTVKKKKGIVGKSGGTTGASLKVIYTKEDIQYRFALVDNFRNKQGYELGKKVAWFSGKKLLNKSDIVKNRYWRTDFFYKVRYYSTYHININTIEYYLENLISYQPEYIIGFPSNIYEIAKYGLTRKVSFPHCIKAVFTNAETLSEDMRETINVFFHSNVYDQYGSAEGAPFIFECSKGKYHMELQCGVYEVLDDSDSPSREGRLVLTSFPTKGTPLIRYDIGDIVKLSDTICECGNKNPTVDYIIGRQADFIYSPETGKINTVNIANCTKNVNGIIKFQIVQDEINKVTVYVIKESSLYHKKDENAFRQNLIDRLGAEIIIEIKYVSDLAKENSGKFRLLKNNILNIVKELEKTN